MPAFTIETSRVVDAPLDVVWSVISDAGGYHTVVDTLTHTEITSGQGNGMVRHCVDTKGREWNETCTMWNEADSFRMTVDLASYPASFRAIFKRVEGTWSVTPTETGTLITIRFDGETNWDRSAHSPSPPWAEQPSSTGSWTATKPNQPTRRRRPDQ